MTQSRPSLGELPNVIGKEVTRLFGAGPSVSARDELCYSVWPFLRDLVDALQSEIEAIRAEIEYSEEEPIPIELAARAIELLGRLAAVVDPRTDEATVRQLAKETLEVVHELVALSDEEQLAEQLKWLRAGPSVSADVAKNEPVSGDATSEASQ